MQKEQREFGANNVMSTLIDRLAAAAPKIGCGNVLIELAVPKNKDADNEKRKQEHHYWRVIVTYNDGETSGNRVFSAANAPNSKVRDATGRVGELGRATGPGFRKQ